MQPLDYVSSIHNQVKLKAKASRRAVKQQQIWDLASMIHVRSKIWNPQFLLHILQ